jgi:hypothetical protein
MNRKTLAIVSALIISLLVTAVSTSVTTLAQGAFVYNSAYQIQNLESTEATVNIEYFDQDSTATYSGTVNVPGNGSKTIFPFISGPFGDNISGPATFNGSVVLSSDKQIAAILNTEATSPFYGASTNGFSEGATELNLPLIACNNSGFDTWFNVQNVGTSAATVEIEYIPGAFGSGSTDTGITIDPYRAMTFDQSATSTTGTKRCGSGLGTRFVGSAKVTSTNGQPLVASTMFMGTASIKVLQGYNGFVSGSETVNLPLIMANNSGYYTSIQVQNAGAGPADVTVSFGANTIGNTNTPNAETFTLIAGEAKTLIQAGGIGPYSPSNDWAAFGQYVSGATISQSGSSEPLVAVVNQTQGTTFGSAYEGFDPGGATGTINLPLIAANNSGYLTGIQIQAVSGAPQVTVDYGTNTGSGTLVEPVNDTKTLNTGETWTLIQAGAPGPLTGNNNWSTAGQYVGSAKVSATAGTVIAIVNFNGSPSMGGDRLYTYTGFNE